MSDLKLSESEQRELEAIANGTAPWNDKFEKLIDDNRGAVETLVRGTSFPYCAWGVDYELGVDTPIPQISRGRVLARLNVLMAQRFAARGESEAATQHLIAGIRFSRDLSQNLPLIGALTGKLALASDLNAATALARSGKLARKDQERLAQTVRAMPGDAFDWSAAMRVESVAIRQALVRLKRARDPQKLLVAWGIDLGKSTTDARPSDADLQRFDAAMTEAIRLLKLPPNQADRSIAVLSEKIQQLNPAVRGFIPSLQRTNDARKQVEQLRQDFLRSVSVD